jgi:uncharacterized protein (TIGR00730 family)
MMTNDNRPRKPKVSEVQTLIGLQQDMYNRVENITREFQEGLEFIQKHNKSVTFFGSARTMENEKDYVDAQNLAKKIVQELGYSITTGGGPGIMEAANRGAFESGGESLGLTIKLPMEQVTNKYLTEHFDFKYFFSRKVCMSFAAEAYIFFPGGFGTMDEFFEILTLVQTEKMSNVPIILFGNDFWNNLNHFIKENLLKEEKIDEQDVNLYTITEDMDEIIEIIKQSPVRITG